MYFLTPQITNLLAISTMVGQFFLLAFFLLLLINKYKPLNFFNSIIKIITKFDLYIVFSIALTGIIFSLFYSEIALLEPCKLCWYQRIVIYPQVIIYGMGIYLKDKAARVYGMALAILAFLIAGYQYLLQMSAVFKHATASFTDCSLSIDGPSCSSYYFLEYGYITIPMMSLTAMAMIIVVLCVSSCSYKVMAKIEDRA